MNNIKPQANGPVTSYSFLSSSLALSNITGLTRVASKILANFFSSVQALPSKPIFTVSGNKVVINIFYYISSSRGNKALSSSTINSVGEVLSKLFNRPVELHLVRLHYPYLNSYILAQYIAINTAKYNFTRIISRLWGANAIFGSVVGKDASNTSSEALSTDTTTIIPRYVTGMKVRISGRLVTQRSVPRQSVQTAQVGSFSSTLIEAASFTSKNKKGAFTVKVWIGQSPLDAKQAVEV